MKYFILIAFISIAEASPNFLAALTEKPDTKRSLQQDIEEAERREDARELHQENKYLKNPTKESIAPKPVEVIDKDKEPPLSEQETW